MIAVKLLPSRLWPSSPQGKRAAAGAMILVGAVLTSASIFATGPSPAPEVVAEKAWPVSVVTAEPSARSPAFTAYGQAESSRVAHITTDLIAAVKAVHVHEGDWVAAGDLLVELADDEAALVLEEREADLAQAQAQLESISSERAMLEHTLAEARSMNRIAQDKLARHQQLKQAQLISQSLLDEVVAQANRAAIDLADHERRLNDLPHRIAAQQALVKKARALVDQARLDLAKTQITAPFSGPVLAVNVAPGDRSSLNTALLEMADSDAFEVRVQVPAGYEARFRRYLDGGQPITATLRNGQELSLARLASRVRPGQSGLDAFFRPATATRATFPALGRVVDMLIRLPEEAGVVALPVAALYENDRIYAVDERHRLQAISVERVGELQTRDGEYQVLVRAPELSGGREVITTQLPKAASGLLVQPSQPDARLPITAADNRRWPPA